MACMPTLVLIYAGFAACLPASLLYHVHDFKQQCLLEPGRRDVSQQSSNSLSIYAFMQADITSRL